MRISRNQFIVTAAAVGCVFFLWYYLQLPLAFVISIVVSIILIALALKYKSSLVRGLCVFLIAAHMVRLALYLVPVYDKQPDVRLRYRSAPSALFSIPGSEGSMQLSIEEKGEMYVIAPPLLTKGVAVFNGTHILSQWGDDLDRVIMGFRDGSTFQLFRNSELTVDALRPDYANLTGSRIAVTLHRGELSASSQRSNKNVSNRSVRAGSSVFSCDHCVVSYSGGRGTVISMTDFQRADLSGTTARMSGWSYEFTNSSLQKATNNTTAMEHLTETLTTSNRYFTDYLRARDAFFAQHFWRELDTSLLLSYLSKTKMALMWLVDWSYWSAYNELQLYEHLRGKAELPSDFEKEKYLYEFIR